MSNKMFYTSASSMQVALLILRIGIGVIFMMHGWPKISGGVDTWSGIGGAMGVVGLNFAPAFWGFMAAFAEFFGGLLLVLGFLTRPAAAIMFITMLVAALMHIQQGDAITSILHPLKGLVVFLSLLISGAGKYSIDRVFARKR